MGLFSRFESRAEDVIEGSGSSRGGIEPVKLAKRACKEMEREKMVGVGHEYAPTLYNVLVSAEDDMAMGGYYASLAGEIETYLTSRANQSGLVFDCPPLVRFIVDEGLKRGKFDIIAESVSPQIITELRHEEMVRYGLEEPEGGQDFGYEPESGYGQPAYEPQPYDPQPYDPQPAYGEPAYEPAPYEPQPVPEPEAYEPAPAPAPVAAAAAGAVAGAAAQAAQGAERTVLMGDVAPAEPTAHLVNRITGQTFEISGARTVIGREANCDIVILDPSVSRRHAEILHSDAGWLVRDTGSTNGTKVNGVASTQSQIYSGDVLDLGKTSLEFQEG